jgi:CRP-like cAMP-binding protein
VEAMVGRGAEAKPVARLAPGQYFGEMALITSHPRNATVRAIDEIRVAVLGKQNFLTLVNLMPSTREDIIKTVNERAMQKAVGQ